MHIPKWYVMFQIIRYLIKMMITIYSFLLWGSAMTSWWLMTAILLVSSGHEREFVHGVLHWARVTCKPGSLPWQSAHTLVIKWLMHTKRYSDHIHAGYRYILWPKNVKSRCQAALYKLNLGFDITVDVTWSGTAARLCYNRQYAEVKNSSANNH